MVDRGRGEDVPPSSSKCEERVIGFIDLDCFYVAVERSLDPSLIGIPCAVCQYETWRRDAPDLAADSDRRMVVGGAGLIAVSYEARARGVKRGALAPDARKACPELVVVSVPTSGNKANLDIYKKAGQQVVEILSEFATTVEKRSVDEVAIDVTEAAAGADPRLGLSLSHLADSEDSLVMSRVSHDASRRGHERQQNVARSETDVNEDDLMSSLSEYERLLLGGSAVVARARAAVKQRLGFTCSGGIAPTKLMAKVGCGLHKPDQQTVVFPRSAASLLRDMPLDRLPGLGGDLGKRVVRELGVSTAGDVTSLPKSAWGRTFDASEREWLLSVCSGTYAEPVKDRSSYKSFASSKTFYKQPLCSVEDCVPWLASFAAELWHRIEDDRAVRHRAPTNVTVSIYTENKNVTRTEKISIGSGGSMHQIQQAGARLIRKWAGSLPPQDRNWKIKVLGLTVSNFEDLPKGTASITGFFAPKATLDSVAVQQAPPDVDDEVFNSLPANIQAELRDDRKRRLHLGRGVDGMTLAVNKKPSPSTTKKRKTIKLKHYEGSSLTNSSIRSFFKPDTHRRE